MAYRLIDQSPSGTQNDGDGQVLFENRYMCDSATDIASLPTSGIADGSVAMIPSTGDLYILYDEEWVLI